MSERKKEGKRERERERERESLQGTGKVGYDTLSEAVVVSEAYAGNCLHILTILYENVFCGVWMCSSTPELYTVTSPLKVDGKIELEKKKLKKI